MATPAVFGIYGQSNSGKTTLLVKLVSHFTRKGYRVATIKCSDKSLSLESKGKDTWRHHKAGASLVVFSAAGETDFFVHLSMTTAEILRIIAAVGHFDVVFMEGANDLDTPKIQIGTGRKRPHTIASYKNNFNDLVSLIQTKLKTQLKQRLNIWVNGKEIPLTEFPVHILTNTLLGMLSSLKGVQTITDVTITLNQ